MIIVTIIIISIIIIIHHKTQFRLKMREILFLFIIICREAREERIMHSSPASAGIGKGNNVSSRGKSTLTLTLNQ